MIGFRQFVGGVVTAAALILSPPAWAGSDTYSPASVAQIDILPGWRDAGGTHVAALRIRLAEGWKTYWRSPGDAGIPPAFDWAGSKNLKGVRFHWPVPTVYEQNGLRTIGYQRELVLPMTLTPRSTGDKIALKGRISLGVCREVCMPMEARFSAVLPAGAGAPVPAIAQALARRAETAAEAGVRAVSCDVQPIADGLRLTAEIAMPRVGRGEVAVIETADQAIWVAEASTSRQAGTLRAVTDLVGPTGAPFLLSRSDIRITVLADGRAVDIQGCRAGS